MTEAKSAQPQLPPLEPNEDDWQKAHECNEVGNMKDFPSFHCRERQLLSALAENESLKAHSEQYRQNWRAILRELGCECHLDALELIARIKAERDKMLEVIREYRERLGRYNHGLDCLGAGACGVTDDRCPICIKADDLLSREPKKEK